METKCPRCGCESRERRREAIINQAGKLVERVYMLCPNNHCGRWITHDDSITNYADHPERVSRQSRYRHIPAKEDTVELAQPDQAKSHLRAQKREKARARDMSVIDHIAEKHDRQAKAKRTEKMKRRIRRYTED